MCNSQHEKIAAQPDREKSPTPLDQTQANQSNAQEYEQVSIAHGIDQARMVRQLSVIATYCPHRLSVITQDWNSLSSSSQLTSGNTASTACAPRGSFLALSRKVRKNSRST